MSRRIVAKQILSITDTAAKRIQSLVSSSAASASTDKIIGVRVGLKKRGCSGLSYTMNYATPLNISKNDEVVDDKGVKVYVDPQAVMFLVGTTMDFVENEMGSEFVFNNPNKKSECGCGQSFNV